MLETAQGQPHQRTGSAWQGLLLLAVGVLVAWASMGPGLADSLFSVLGHVGSRQAEISQLDSLGGHGAVRVFPAAEHSQDELETLSEQLEDPLLALGGSYLGLDPSLEGDAGEHGSVVGWAVCVRALPSSTARGPPHA